MKYPITLILYNNEADVNAVVYDADEIDPTFIMSNMLGLRNTQQIRFRDRLYEVTKLSASIGGEMVKFETKEISE